MAATVTIRVTPETRDVPNRRGAARGVSAGELVGELATRAEDRRMLEAAAQHYEELRSDPEAWADYRAEISAWDATSAGRAG